MKPKQVASNLRTCCVCGSAFYAFQSSNKKSCGSAECSKECRSIAKKRHGDSGSRLYNIWCGMHRRCKYSKYYQHVAVADEWSSYEMFRKWALASGYVDGFEIDRIDNRKGYSPENCRWATRSQQMQNRGITRRLNKTSRFKGVQRVRHCKKQWRALANVDGKPRQIGLFETEEEAAKAWDEWSKKEYGEFSSPNFKEK